MCRAVSTACVQQTSLVMQNAYADVTPDQEDAFHPTGQWQETQGARATADATVLVSEKSTVPLHNSDTSPQFVDEADEADFIEAMRYARQEQEREDVRARSESMDDATGSVSEVSLIALRRSYIYYRMCMQA